MGGSRTAGPWRIAWIPWQSRHYQQGRIMKRTGFALAFMATIAMTVMPVAPSFAAAPKQQMSANQALAESAARGDVVVLSPAQMNQLSVSNPALHAKLSAAHQSGAIPKFTQSEKRYVTMLTKQNIADIKAGDGGAWVVVAVVAVVLLLLWQPVVCVWFPWAIGCVAPARR